MKIKTLKGSVDFTFDELNGDRFDILAVGFRANERINYSKELRGETNTLKNFAEATKDGGALIYAIDTDNYGIIKHSAAVFENGKLLGISDMTESYSDTPYMPGANGKLYDLQCGKIGLAVGDDILSYELVCGLRGGSDCCCYQKQNKRNERDRNSRVFISFRLAGYTYRRKRNDLRRSERTIDRKRQKRNLYAYTS